MAMLCCELLPDVVPLTKVAKEVLNSQMFNCEDIDSFKACEFIFFFNTSIMLLFPKENEGFELIVHANIYQMFVLCSDILEGNGNAAVNLFSLSINLF